MLVYQRVSIYWCCYNSYNKLKPPGGTPNTASRRNSALREAQEMGLVGAVGVQMGFSMENGPFIDGLPIKNGDFPWLC